VSQPRPALPPDAQAFLDNQVAEYDTYRAAGPIKTASGAPAYNLGETIPASNVGEDGRVALERHVCHPTVCDSLDGLCDLHSQVTVWSDPGLAVPTEAGKKRLAARKAAETRAAKSGDKPASDSKEG
jgi:hypothetical protein